MDFLPCMNRERISGIFSSYNDISPAGLGPHLGPRLTLITPLRALSPSTVTLGVKASTSGFGGVHNSVHNT